MGKKKTTKKEPAPEPMVFAQVPVEEKPPYDRIADRVLKAVQEFNEAIKEAHECTEMRVFISTAGNGEMKPLQLSPQIYRMTHSTLTFVIKPAVESKMEWRQVKDPAFKDAAGQGWAGMKLRTA